MVRLVWVQYALVVRSACCYCCCCCCCCGSMCTARWLARGRAGTHRRFSSLSRPPAALSTSTERGNVVGGYPQAHQRARPRAAQRVGVRVAAVAAAAAAVSNLAATNAPHTAAVDGERDVGGHHSSVAGGRRRSRRPIGRAPDPHRAPRDCEHNNHHPSRDPAASRMLRDV